MSIVPKCDQCRQVIPAEDVNVGKDLAFCRRCNLASSLTEMIAVADEGGPIDLRQPLPGTWYRNGPDGLVVGASHRSWKQALGLLGVSLFWNGIVSVFVLLNLAATLHLLHVPLPAWFPAPSSNGDMGVGMVIFLWLFLTPFLVIGAGMVLGFLSTLVGRTEVRIHRGAGSVFVGAGPLGRTRRFETSQVKKVRLAENTGRNNTGQPAIQLELKDGKTLDFGKLLSPERQQFMLQALRQAVR